MTNSRIFFRQPRLIATITILAVVLVHRFSAWFFGVESTLLGIGSNAATPLDIGLLTA